MVSVNPAVGSVQVPQNASANNATKQIIDAHNGEIHATSSRENETSTFGFSIPKTYVEVVKNA